MGVEGDFEELIFDDDDVIARPEVRDACEKGKPGGLLDAIFELTREGKGLKARADACLRELAAGVEWWDGVTYVKDR